MGNQDFVLIESLDELASWKPSSANPLHISNTPLLPRPTASIAPPSSAAEWPQGTSQSEPNENSIGSRPSPAPISKLLICHDFKGGYLPYEAPQGAETTERVYTYEYLQFVDSFVYFSHKRVAIPPASWINHMHKNGVKILGTFIVEGRNGTSELEDLLWHEYEDPTKFVFVDKLVEIAQIYKFDGWLLNFESSFPSEIFNLPTFKAWLESLRTEMHRAVPGSQVIWYDALTIDNEISYQNGITDANKPFFDISDGIFTNYWWRIGQLQDTARIATALGRPSDVYSGIDVFGRGTLGDGGFNVGQALSAIQSVGLAAALFAPGWTYEHLGVEKFWENDKKFWVGDESLPGGPMKREEPASVTYGPISQYARLLGSGDSHFFYTNFSRGFGKGWRIDGRLKSSKPWVHLGAQSVLPTYYNRNRQSIKWSLDDRYAYCGSWSLAISTTPTDGNMHDAFAEIFTCPLYKMRLSMDKHTSLAVRYIVHPTDDKACIAETGLYIDIQAREAPGNTLRKYLAFDGKPGPPWQRLVISPLLDRLQVKATFRNSEIVEVGVYCRPGSAGNPKVERPSQGVENPSAPVQVPLVNLGELCISHSAPRPHQYGIVCIEKHTTTDGLMRLSWELRSETEDPPASWHGPSSGTTGPFAYFVVYRGQEMLGLAFALEYILSDNMMGGIQDQEFHLDGVMWNGTVVSSQS